MPSNSDIEPQHARTTVCSGFDDSLLSFVGRIRVLTELTEATMRQEFRHRAEVVKEWNVLVLQLQRSLMPIQQFVVAGTSDQGLIEWQQTVEPSLSFVEHRIVLALEHLRCREAHPVSAIHGALRELTQARVGLLVWQQSLLELENAPSLSQLNLQFSPSREEARADLERAYLVIGQRFREESDSERCANSRRLFLNLFSVLVLYPDLFTDSLHHRLIDRLASITDSMEVGSFRLHVQRRLTELRALSPQEYGRTVVQLSEHQLQSLSQ